MPKVKKHKRKTKTHSSRKWKRTPDKIGEGITWEDKYKCTVRVEPSKSGTWIVISKAPYDRPYLVSTEQSKKEAITKAKQYMDEWV